jgi:hypothetical protein
MTAMIPRLSSSQFANSSIRKFVNYTLPMFVHIVFWRLHGKTADGKTKAENAQEMKRLFENLRGKLPGLQRLDLGIDISQGGDSADVALYTEFVDKAAYDHYYAHPLHVQIMEFMKGVRDERRVVDYEI